MAETKTTIPVKIKMGAEKIARTVAKDGTDIAASNLPEFEEGSLIICKDTGNLYIDMPNESKRYSVGIGHQSINRGETFNNHYNMNCALADSTYAAGYKTQAGYNYFKVTAIDVVNKKITLGDATGLVAGLTYDILDFNVLNDKMKRAVHGTISKIEGTVVTVDNLPENTDADKLANLRFTIRIDFNTVTPTNPITNQVYGNIQTNGGDQAYAIGERARAIGFDTFVGGQNNTAYGNCSSVLGRSNTAYGNNEFISGNKNVTCGSNSAVFGARNESKGNQNFTAGALNTSNGNFQTVIGLCNDNKTDTLFEVGNGEYENTDGTIITTVRSNAFEVYMDGHAEIQTQGLTDKSVVTKNYVDSTINTKLSTVYKPQGSTKFSELLTTLTATQEGFVYNISEEFTTTDLFIEGAGKKFPSGTNIVVVKDDSTYKYDVLAGMVDLSSYVTNENLTSALTNKQDNLYLTATKHSNGVVNITSSNELSINKLHISDYSSAQGPAVVLSLGDISSGIEFESDDSISYFGSEIVNKKSLLNFITNGFSTEREQSLTITSYNGNIYLNDKNSQGCKIRRLYAGTEDNDAVNLSQLNTKQDILVSGDNIKTINGQSILGSGNITIEGGGSGSTVVVDDDLSDTSTNPVQNKIVTASLNSKQANLNLKYDTDGKLVHDASVGSGSPVIGFDMISANTIANVDYIFSGGLADGPGFRLMNDHVVLLPPSIDVNADAGNGVLTGVLTLSTADSIYGVTDDNLPYQAANKLYVDNKTAADTTVSSGSSKLITSGAVYTALTNKQNDLGLKSTKVTVLSSNVQNLSVTDSSIDRVNLVHGSSSICMLQDSLFVGLDGEGGTSATFTKKNTVKFSTNRDNKNANVYGVATPISAADTTLGITTDDLPYQVANKDYVDTAAANKQDTFSTVTTTADETTLTADKPINITTNKYSMVYDDINEAIKITFA